MSPNLIQLKYHKQNFLKLLSCSIATAMTLGLLVSIPREVAGQAQPSPSVQQSPELAEAKRLNEQARQLRKKGEYTEAIPLAKRALAIREKKLGKQHPKVATSLNNLALLYDAQRNYEKAELLYQRSLAIREKVLGKEHPDVATSLNNLANLYWSQGNYAKAEPFYERSLAIREKVLGKEHSDVAQSLNNLALIYWLQGSYEKVEPLYQRSLAIREKKLGKEHPDVAISLNNLAVLYRAQGSYENAEPFYQRSLIIREKVLGKEHPDVAQSLNNLANLYSDQGYFEKAEPFYQRSLAIMEKLLGKEHPDVAQSLNNLANLYLRQGNYDRAEPLYQRSLAIREKVLGKEHLDVAASLNNLAILYRLKGNYERVETLYQRSLAIAEKVVGKEHPYVATRLNNLANFYSLQRNYNRAKPLYQRSLVIREKELGKEHPKVAQSLNNLANLYSLQENYEQAEPLYQRSLAIREKVFGKEHPDVASSLNNLAIFYWAQGNISRATDFLSRGLTVQEKNLQLIYVMNSEQGKQRYAQLFREQTNNAVSLALQKPSNNSTINKLALTTVLRRKGRVLDAMTDTIQTLRTQLADNPEAKELFDDWLDVQKQLANLVYRGLGKEKIEIYQNQIKQLQTQKEKLENQLSYKSAEFRKEIQPVELADIQAQIPQDAALVEIYQYKPFNPKPSKVRKKRVKSRYAVAVLRSSGEPSWVDLDDAATINKSIASLRSSLIIDPSVSNNQSFKKKALEASQKKAQKLYEQVIAPIRPLLGDARHLLLSPDGQLNLIPFEALYDDDRKEYLVQRYALSYLTSGRDLLRLETTANKTSPPVVFADIDYKQQDINVAAKTHGIENRRSNDFASLKFERLPATSEEGKQIKKIFPDTNLFTGKQATEGVIKEIPTPNILHLATHGFFLPEQEKPDVTINDLNQQLDQPIPLNIENPLLRSGLALAGFNERQNKQTKNSEDGVLTALEVAGLNLRGTQLVVLSGCDTGKGDVRAGEGVYGLRRVLTLAGSQSQLLSLWKVSDEGTKELMVKYYSKLKQGKGRHQALREVQLELLSNPEYQHPYYWASFILSGNWKGMKSDFSPDVGKSIFAVSLGVVVLFAGVIGFKLQSRKMKRLSLI